MPILGIIDSAKTGNLITSNFYLLQSYTFPNDSTNSVTFSGLTDEYNNLQLRYVAQQYTGGSSAGDAQVIINGNDPTNASWGRTYSVGSSVSGSSGTSGYIGSQLGAVPGYGTAASFGVGIFNFFNARNSSQNKIFTWFGGVNNGTSNSGESRVGFASNYVASTSATSSITFKTYTGSAFTSGSVVSLYGWKD